MPRVNVADFVFDNDDNGHDNEPADREVEDGAGQEADTETADQPEGPGAEGSPQEADDAGNAGAGTADDSPQEEAPQTARRRAAPRPLSKAAAAAHKKTSPKFAQLRGDQQIELDILARELQAARTSKRERITANTVIRVAIDALLTHRDVLVGDTEEELLRSYLDYFKRLEDQKSEASRHRES